MASEPSIERLAAACGVVMAHGVTRHRKPVQPKGVMALARRILLRADDPLDVAVEHQRYWLAERGMHVADVEALVRAVRDGE